MGGRREDAIEVLREIDEGEEMDHYQKEVFLVVCSCVEGFGADRNNTSWE